jgi:predicted esterase YcpF (UPF0227 family)
MHTKGDYNLYYIHGYLSEPNSTKGVLFKDKLNAQAIKYRDCKPQDLVISDCVKIIKDFFSGETNVVLIGSSLGGLLAAKVSLNNPRIKHLILLNPAIIPPDVDINEISDMPKRILAEMKDPNLFEKKIESEIIILIGTNDDVVPNDWGILFAKKQNATVKFFDDDHSFSYNMNQLPNIIGKYLNKSIN